MSPVGFESTISAGQRPQIYALDRAATGTGHIAHHEVQNLKISASCILYFVLLYSCHNKQRLFLYTTSTDWFFITEAKCVSCAVRTGPWNKIQVIFNFTHETRLRAQTRPCKIVVERTGKRTKFPSSAAGSPHIYHSTNDSYSFSSTCCY